jgi:hypothetical protein
LLVALVLNRQHPAAASELLANGDFEEGTTGWTTNAGQLDAVSAPLHGGSQAARFSGSGQPTIQFAYQLIDVQPASNYELSGWVAAPISGVSRAFLRVSWFDARGSLVLSADSPWLAQPDGTFQLLATGAMVSPVAARQARTSLLIQAESPFTIHLDDFAFSGPSYVPPPATPPPQATPAPQVTPHPTPLPPGKTPGPVPTPTRTPRPGPSPKATASAPGNAEPDSFPHLINGGFEDRRGDGTPYAWHKQGGEISTVTEHRTEGERGLVLTSDTTATKWAYQTVSAQPGAYYEASVQAFAGPGAESAFLRLSWYASADGTGQAIASIDSLDAAVQATAGAFRRLTTGPVQAPADANSVKLRLMLRPASGEPAAAYFDDAQFGPTEPAPGETVRVAGRAPAFGSEDASLAEVAAPDGLAPGRETPGTLANVKPARPGAQPPASAREGRDDWAILLAIATVLVAIALTAGHWFWQRNHARKARADDT